jgi:serine protease Do
MKKFFSSKVLVAVVLVFAAGIFLGSFFNAPQAKANIFGDFLKNFLAPFIPQATSTQGTSSTAASPQPPPSLYKPALDYEKAVVEAVKKVSPAVVSITISKNVPIIEQCPYNPFSDLPPEFQQFFGDQYPQFYEPCEKGTKLQEVGSGSGFIISSNGLILTNKHVVLDRKASYTVFTNDGKKYDAKVLARDPSQDLAVLKIEGSGFPIVELGDSDTLELGQTAIAIGNALGEFRNTVSVGVISGLARTVTASGGGLTETIHGVIQTDAAINPGNSGGPLINLMGQVIGINTAMASGANNIGFAIPINRAKRDIESVKTSGEIQAAFLGVRYLILTPEIAKKQKLPVEDGALLRGSNDGPAVEPNSPAEKAGIQAEDIIIEVNAKKITQENPLGAVISQFGVGDTITLKIIRGGKEITVQTTLAKRPE